MSKRLQRVNRALFSVILKKGKIYHSPHLSLRVFEAGPEKLSAFAVVISKKVTKLAVKRNRLKRQARQIIHDNFLMLEKPYIGALFFKKGSDRLAFKELKREFQTILSKAGISRQSK